MNVGTIYKLPTEVLTRVVDFSNDLALGETIASINSTTAVLFPSGPDESGSIIGPVSPFIPAGNTTVQFQVQNGAIGQLFTITITVTSSASNIFVAQLTLAVGLEIDLTTLSNVKNWLQIKPTVTTDDQIIQDAITAFSAYIIHLAARGPADGSYPTQSPFVTPVSYDEFYDGTGTDLLLLRNWPVMSVSSVKIDGRTLQQSSAPGVFGWVLNSDGKFLGIRGGNQSYSRRAANCVGFTDGMQNVEVNYSAGFATVPTDLEMVARKTVALNYKRRGWIGQRSQMMAAGAGSVIYGTWEMDADAVRVVDYYKARG